LPSEEVYKFFSFEPRVISNKISMYLEAIERGDLLRNEFLKL